MEMIGGRPTKMDLSRFRYGRNWTECIEQVWFKQLKEREKRIAKVLE